MISPIAFNILGIDIRWYGIAYSVTFILSIELSKYFSVYVNLEKKDIDIASTFIIIGVILGARLGEFLFYSDHFFTYEIFYFRNGGMSFHGGVLGVILGSLIYSFLYRKNFWAILDLTSIGAPIGCFLGRCANFINQEVIGIETDFFELGRHPVSLYEAFFEGIVLFFITFSYAKKIRCFPSGNVSAVFALFYAIFRILLENFRTPDGMIGFLSKGQFYSFIMLLFALMILFKNRSIKNN